MSTPTITTVEVDTLVAGIRSSFEAAWRHFEDGCRLLVEAHQIKAWEPLGLPNWAAFVAYTLDVDHLKIPKAERQNIVQALSDGGLSVREVAVATGLGVGTVHRELKPGVPNGTPSSGSITWKGAMDKVLGGLDRALIAVDHLPGQRQQVAALREIGDIATSAQEMAAGRVQWLGEALDHLESTTEVTT